MRTVPVRYFPYDTGSRTIEGNVAMYVSYDLAKAVQKERLARSMAEFERRRDKTTPEPAPRQVAREAEVIELVFGSHCETDQIGA